MRFPRDGPELKIWVSLYSFCCVIVWIGVDTHRLFIGRDRRSCLCGKRVVVIVLQAQYPELASRALDSANVILGMMFAIVLRPMEV